jgi:hypothetical protein
MLDPDRTYNALDQSTAMVQHLREQLRRAKATNNGLILLLLWLAVQLYFSNRG